MKKILMLVAALALSLFAFAAPASATNDDHPSADNKKVPLCHATGSESNPYTRPGGAEGLPVPAFLQAGHGDHEGDIYETFTYTTVGGDTITVPGRGDTSLLAFEDCVRPRVNEQVARPDVTFADPCGTENDVFAVAGGRGFTVGSITTDGVKQSITVTLLDGFDWVDGLRDSITFERPVFTDVDCDIPDTGAAETAKTASLIAVGGVVLMGAMTLIGSRRRRSLI